MLSSRLFWKLFGVYAALSTITAVCTVSFLTNRQREIVYDHVYHRLRDSAVTLLNRVGDPFSGGLDAELNTAIHAIAKENDTRITLIADDGKVVIDSRRDAETMENHGNRPEILEAKSKRIGSAQRVSPTLGIPMLYVAIRVGEPKIDGYVRVSQPLVSVEKEVSSVQNIVIMTSVFGSLLALAPLFFILQRLIQPLTTLKDAAIAIGSGELQQNVQVESKDELGTLADAFNKMSHELAARMSQLNQTSLELRESSELMATMFGSMIEGVIAVDNEERVLFANSAADGLLDLGDPAGRPVWECIRNESIQTVIRQALTTGHRRSAECKMARSELVVEVEATPLAGNPCPGVVIVCHDVTELRRLENVRRDFASNVSHELKTPLTIIQTATETLLDGAVEDAEFARRFLSRIDEQGERLQGLIFDLLQLASIESGEEAFEISSVELQPMLESLVEEFSDLAQSRKVTLELIAPDEQLFVEAASDAFRTIIENLVSNALKYTLAGGQVRIAWRRDQAHAVVDVQDTGVGISREHQARIFERFYRVDRARSRELGGTGLGLSIVKHLANSFAATVSVNSEVGKGSTFSVRIPLAPESQL